jgi:hypothetical protein
MSLDHGIAPATSRFAAPEALARIQRRALVVGGVAALACIVGAILQPARFMQSYLVGLLLWLGVALGCLALLMLHHMAGGAWGLVVRRVNEAATRTLPLLALLFVPVLLGVRSLYAWARPGTVTPSNALYLNVPAFALRAAVYFTLWGSLAFLLSRWSRRQDATGDPFLARRMRVLAGPGFGLYVLTVTFAGVDWLMSLQPHWYSTIYGFYVVVGQGVSAFAFVILAARWLSEREPLSGVLVARHFDDHAKLLLACVLLWMYFSFSQFLIIWSGNLREEIPFYLVRRNGSWKVVSMLLFLFHFVVPLLALLLRDVKRNPARLSGVAALLLVMCWLDLYFQASPVFHPLGVSLHWLDLAVPVALGGLWLASFLRELRGAALLPIHDPQLEAAISHD